MKRQKIMLIIGALMALMLACSLVGGNQNNQQNNQQNQSNNQQDQNTNDTQNENNDQDNNLTGDNNDNDTTPPTTGFGGDGPLWDTDFGKLLASGDLEIVDISANANEETVGEILTIRLKNNSDEDLDFFLPCGLVFAPTNSDEQSLMLVQALEISLEGGGTAEFTPYVVCIQMAALAPALNSGYVISHLEEGDLLALAECLCGQVISGEAGSMESVGVQFAAWSIATGGDPFSMLDEEENSALADFISEMEDSGMGEMVNEMLDMYGGEYLDMCGIQVGD